MINPLAPLTLALSIAVAMVLGAAVPGGAAAHRAQPGVERVICADGAEKTIRVDAEGVPIETSQDQDCSCPGCDCLAPAADVALPAAGGAVAGSTGSGSPAAPAPRISLPAEPGLRPEARGPPPEDAA